MMNAFTRSRRLIWVWAGASAATTLYWQLTQGGVGLIDAMVAPDLWISALLGLIIACLLAPCSPLPGCAGTGVRSWAYP